MVGEPVKVSFQFTIRIKVMMNGAFMFYNTHPHLTSGRKQHKRIVEVLKKNFFFLLIVDTQKL